MRETVKWAKNWSKLGSNYLSCNLDLALRNTGCCLFNNTNDYQCNVLKNSFMFDYKDLAHVNTMIDNWFELFTTTMSTITFNQLNIEFTPLVAVHNNYYHLALYHLILKLQQYYSTRNVIVKIMGVSTWLKLLKQKANVDNKQLRNLPSKLKIQTCLEELNLNLTNNTQDELDALGIAIAYSC